MWLIYYGDGVVLSDKDHTPFTLPKRADVQVIIQPDPKYVWFSQCGDDYYVWRGDRWWGVDHFGLYDYLLQPGEKCVLFGRTIDNEDFHAIFEDAREKMHELTGYYKGAFRGWERKPNDHRICKPD